MDNSMPRYSKQEFARRGDEIYEQSVRSHLKKSDEGKLTVIDIETGDYEIDADELIAHDRLLSRKPDAQVWVTQVGSRYARRFGVEKMDAEQLQSGSSDKFWRFIEQRRGQKTISRAELEKKLGEKKPRSGNNNNKVRQRC
jgi:hypothetical protein